ncbi:pheromone-processing carboxypeptidase KEX1 [Patellaria atrata CBS 101060]|uniref:Carboxypeptidase n=1 Tax=Patellaria atrata CBS 101060 TaxID=1346257 RepID=A0A9P4SF81_9PEZI|nr:pheromone-processing carboxypeptidase KEX1 [Patellaria atrata CBS 101060]
MHAGHIEVSAENNGHLFFWHFQNRHIADSQKTVIWLNGGPGCSSMDGALMEIGPYRVGPGGKLRYNNGSWDEFANVLFVDNPVGTGFSYVDTNSYVHELPEMAEQFITFLESWFSIFPEYSHDEIYLAGESYAGQHIPYIAKAILDRNKVSQEPWKLSGLLIGNGWIAPGQQYYAYLQYAYKSGLIQGGTDKAKKVEAQQAICQKILETTGQDAVEIPECEEVLQVILRLTNDRSSNQGCVNMYDIRLRDSYPSCGMNWPPDLDHVTPYLRREDVIQALHVDPAKRSGWTECNGAVGSNFRARNSKPSVELLPDLLAELPIILFSGDKDMICNHIGTEELINNLKWNGGVGFERSPGTWAPRQDWTFEEEPAGFYQEARNLTYIVFYNSSHMVPFDYPRRTRDMLDRFIGIDIGDIGGEPADSRIGGEKGPLTSVGSHPNSTAAEEAEEQKLKDATWHAYYKSGEVALVVVAIAAGLWGFFVWRDRRRRRAGYTSLFGGNPHDSRPGSSRGGAGLEGFRNKRHGRDIEAADFDENELDEVSSSESLRKQSDKDREMERERYSLGEDSDDEEVGGSREKLTGGQPR